MEQDVSMYDTVIVHDNGNKEFYDLVHVGGVDENGVYTVVLEGAAEGERVYERNQ